jgi:ATP-dependent DNA helicase RecQ
VDNLTASLNQYFGFDSFRPGQAEALQSLLQGKHTLVIMPTGSGKSLVFQLAALHLPGITLVISPLIALMKDQVDSLEQREIPATFINSTLPSGEQNSRLKKLATGEYRIVYIAPERMRSVPFLKALQQQKVSLLAVDEAHCISEWGHDFRPDYLQIVQLRQTLNNPLTVALTATATPQVQNDIVRLLGFPEAERIVTGFNRPNLFLEVRYTTVARAKLQALSELLTAQTGAAIIYAGTRHDAEDIADFIRQVLHIRAEYYHAGLETSERTRIQDDFMTGRLPIVVATNAFGMGVDRQDVRQVIHLAMPGSLEAYYQEAGRAGRDGLEAKAVLLYAPEDRALQEFFINNSAISVSEMRSLFEALPKQANWMSIDDFTLLTSFSEVKVRLGLAELERAGACERLGDEGLRMLLRRGAWNDQAVAASAARIRDHQQHRKAQLKQMIRYAEANTCRRQIILDHFGDHGNPEAAKCCDNCLAKIRTVPSHTSPAAHPSPIALIILDAVHRQQTKVGREKLALILKGSRAAEIRKFHYDRNIYYGRLVDLQSTQIVDLIDQLIQLGFLKVLGGKYPTLNLTPKGETAILAKEEIQLKLPKQLQPEAVSSKKAEREAGGTVEYTALLLAEGLSPEQIAKRRNLTLSTIYSHLAQLISTGKVNVEAVVSEEVRLQIEAAIKQVGNTDFLMPVKALLPEDTSYGVIRCVVEGWKRANILILAKDSMQAEEDTIDQYLSTSHPRLLKGPWQSGWALGFHSSFAGAEWNRSSTGELAYRLKYQSDLSAILPLVDQSLTLLTEHPELAQVDTVVPVPPSSHRPVDPVSAFANALALKIGIPVLKGLVKTRQTSPQKELHTLAQKHANVAGAFSIQTPVKGKKLLVVDDLYDSGATLEEITHLLQKAGAARICVLTLTRTIHSDA